MKKFDTYKIIITTLFIAILFVGCTSKSATKYSDKNPIYAQLAKYTQIVKIIQQDKVLSLANVTYLNGSKDVIEDDQYQYILIGSYELANDMQDHHRVYMVSEDGNIHKPIDKIIVTPQNPLYDNIPMKNSWASYHIYKFEDIKTEPNLRLQVTDTEGNCKAISFEKE
jgi:hypothetical protein